LLRTGLIAVDAAQRAAASIVADVEALPPPPSICGNGRRSMPQIDALPALDVLISTPSINARKPMLHLTEEDFDRIVGLNLRGIFFAFTRRRTTHGGRRPWSHDRLLQHPLAGH